MQSERPERVCHTMRSSIVHLSSPFNAQHHACDQPTSHANNPNPTPSTPTTNQSHKRHSPPTLTLTPSDVAPPLPPVPALPLGLTAPLLVELAPADALPLELPEVKLTAGRALTAVHAVPVPAEESYPIQLTPALVESWTSAEVEAAYVAEASFVVGPVSVFVVFVCERGMLVWGKKIGIRRKRVG